MSNEIRSAVDFYERHPISAQLILSKLQATRGNLDDVRPEELFPDDQDHYGGLPTMRWPCVPASVLANVWSTSAPDGGPARYFAHRYAADVTGIELTPGRVAGAQELTRLVRLQEKVRVLQGDVIDVPLPTGSQDAVVSQEAFLHVPDLGRVLAEAHRLLRPGGRIAFTNLVAHRPLATADAALLWDGMAIQSFHSIHVHCGLLRRVGFEIESIEDLTAEWGMILAERLAMYQKLRREAQQAGAPAGHDTFYESYVRYVALVRTGMLGGGRFAAKKN